MSSQNITSETAKVVNITPDETTQYIPVCMAGNEIFLAQKDHNYLSVIRPVTQDTLNWNRSDEGMREYLKDLWVAAVQSDDYEESLSTYVEEAKEDYDLDDEENYILKDASGCEVLTDYPEVRKIADAIAEEDLDEPIGTWEAAGCYPPEDEIQIIFNEELYEKLVLQKQ